MSLIFSLIYVKRFIRGLDFYQWFTRNFTFSSFYGVIDHSKAKVNDSLTASALGILAYFESPAFQTLHIFYYELLVTFVFIIFFTLINQS